MTEQELRTSITPCIMAGNTWFVFDEIKAYAGAQVEASVARQQPIFEAAMNAKDTEIAELKAQVEGLKTDMQHSRLIEAAQVKESNELKAEIKRLRDGIKKGFEKLAEIPYCSVLRTIFDNANGVQNDLESLLSPAPVTEGKAKPISNKCRFNIAYVGKCNKSTVSGDFCEQHAGMECRVCGKQATRECGVALQLVCGAPLCDKCTHNHDK